MAAASAPSRGECNLYARGVVPAIGHSPMSRQEEYAFGAAAGRGVIEPGAVHIWRADLQVSADALRHYEGLIAPGERERGGRFRFAADRRRFIVARAVLRILLARIVGQTAAGIVFETGAHGKPSLRGGGAPQFSVSHSDDLAAYAFAERPVGIDVGRRRAVHGVVEMARRNFAPAEQSVLDAASADRRSAVFLHCWTRKEAYVKATGAGLSANLASFSVIGDGDPQIVIDADDELPPDPPIHVTSVAIHPDYACGLATTGPVRALHQFDWLHDRTG